MADLHRGARRLAQSLADPHAPPDPGGDHRTAAAPGARARPRTRCRSAGRRARHDHRAQPQLRGEPRPSARGHRSDGSGEVGAGAHARRRLGSGARDAQPGARRATRRTRQRIVQSEQEIAGLERQRRAAAKQHRLVSAELAAQTTLVEKRLAPRAAAAAAEHALELAVIERDIAALKSAAAGARIRIAETQIAMRAAPGHADRGARADRRALAAQLRAETAHRSPRARVARGVRQWRGAHARHVGTRAPLPTKRHNECAWRCTTGGRHRERTSHRRPRRNGAPHPSRACRQSDPHRHRPSAARQRGIDQSRADNSTMTGGATRSSKGGSASTAPQRRHRGRATRRRRRAVTAMTRATRAGSRPTR